MRNQLKSYSSLYDPEELEDQLDPALVAQFIGSEPEQETGYPYAADPAIDQAQYTDEPDPALAQPLSPGTLEAPVLQQEDFDPEFLDPQRSAMNSDDMMRAQELTNQRAQRNGGDFEQEAYADMRANALKHGGDLSGSDIALPIIAAFLDMGTNKGRGLGSIAGGFAQGIQNKRAAQAQTVNDLGGLSLDAAKRKNESDWNRARIEGDQQDRGLRRDELDLARQIEARRREGKTTAHQLDPSQVELNRANAYRAYVDAGSGWERTGERPPTQLQINADQRGANADKRAEEGAARQARIDKEKEDAALLAQQPIPGTRVKDENAWKSLDPVMRRKVIDAVQGSLTSLDSMDSLRSIRSKGLMIPLRDSERIGQHDLARRALLGGLSPFTRLGTLQKSDIEFLAQAIPEAYNVQDLAQLVGEDPNSEILAGAEKALRDMIQQHLSPYGIEIDYEGRDAKRKPALAGPQAAPPPSATAPPPAVQPPAAIQPKATMGRVGKDPALLQGVQLPAARDVLPVTQQGRGQNSLVEVDDYLAADRLAQDDPMARFDPAFIGQPAQPTAQPNALPPTTRLGGHNPRGSDAALEVPPTMVNGQNMPAATGGDIQATTPLGKPIMLTPEQAQKLRGKKGWVIHG